MLTLADQVIRRAGGGAAPGVFGLNCPAAAIDHEGYEGVGGGLGCGGVLKQGDEEKMEHGVHYATKIALTVPAPPGSSSCWRNSPHRDYVGFRLLRARSPGRPSFGFLAIPRATARRRCR